jgi:hypothetical protein
MLVNFSCFLIFFLVVASKAKIANALLDLLCLLFFLLHELS